MKIQEVSQYMGISQDTLRYYEKIGLLDPIRKNSCGQRVYQSRDVQRLKFLICMRKAGVSIESLQKYVELHCQGTSLQNEKHEFLMQQKDFLLEKKKCIEQCIEVLEHQMFP